MVRQMLVGLLLLVLAALVFVWSMDPTRLEQFDGEDFYPAREIEPGLWIGSAFDASDEGFMRERNIALIVNVTDSVPRTFPGIPFVRIPVQDSVEANDLMFANLAGTVRRITEARREGRNVLVHCFAGISRSATVVAAYLVASRGLSVDDAVAHIRAKKPETFRPRMNFEDALRKFAG